MAGTAARAAGHSQGRRRIVIFGAPEVKEFARRLHPIGRFGAPLEIAEAVLWLCSDKSAFMTGHYIVLDGGFLVGPPALPA